MTLLSIAVCLHVHVGIVHSDHTPLHIAKQVCLNSSMTTIIAGKIGGTKILTNEQKDYFAKYNLALLHPTFISIPNIH